MSLANKHSEQTYPLLDRIDLPSDLRQLNQNELPQLADELRQFLLQSISQSGGHFASNLGTVELTIALHYVFNTPNDRLVWDVGHQAYAHKVLTGRKQALHTIRKKGGLSGFLKITESEYDAFGAGHSSTSVGAGLGMAIASKIKHENRQCVAIIGDGAITGGQVFEAMNHAGYDAHRPDLLVVLNDNNMSISPNVGALNTQMNKWVSLYDAVKDGTQVLREQFPLMNELLHKAKQATHKMLEAGEVILSDGDKSQWKSFEALGFDYTGPVDGHDVQGLTRILSHLKHKKGLRLLHIVTKKGQGYKLAEEDPIAYHGVGQFNQQEGLRPKASSKKSYSQVFGEWVCDMAKQDPRLVVVTPAMREGSGLVAFSEQFPGRYFDVAIAEQHATTLCAGLAKEGLKPVLAIYSTFLQRGYDQLIHDICLQNLNVLLAIDRAGLVGADGATHAGAYDLSFLRCLPNLTIMAPADENECRQMLYTAFTMATPVAVRYPRGGGAGVAIEPIMQALPLGKANCLHRGQKIALLAFGSMVQPALQASKALNASVINMRFIKPLDKGLLKEVAQTHDYLVTLEENVIAGGAGSACLEALHQMRCYNPVLQLGLPDEPVEHAEHSEQLTMLGLDGKGIQAQIEAWLLTLQ